MSAMGANRRTDRLGNVTVDVSIAMREEDFKAIRRLAERADVSISAEIRCALWVHIKRGGRPDPEITEAKGETP